MPTYIPAVRGTTNQLLRAVRQQESLTGNRMTPEQLRAIVEGGLAAASKETLERRRLNERARQFDENLAIRKDAARAEERSAAISGAAQLGSLGYQAFYQVPKNLEIQEKLANAYAGMAGGGVAGGSFGASTGATTSLTVPGSAAGGTVTGTGMTVGGGIGAAGAGMVGGKIGGMVGEGKGSTLGSIAGGAAAGAAYGSIVPGVGTLIGGVVGGIGGLMGSDDGTVICEELNRQGYMPDYVLKLDSDFRDQHISVEEYIGYRFWADKVVRRMRASRLITLLVKPFALAWSYTMANKMDSTVKVNLLRRSVGTLILHLGRPLCRWKFDSVLKGGICHG